ncbi:hypothetical protein RCO27_17790 [Sphingosinicella sp. LHD-64]|uniref:hypothetical protein n=1 Tax=Sphingosinicella sp. LHD-64 TaxID=3072139 RepID=UPI00280E32A6|nr:hypothetical protein [Sphingosinicella sp. LHD-64]MDQ8758083.1 hypothetical protein [Sphingosinicella sp. LHD-64]
MERKLMRPEGWSFILRTHNVQTLNGYVVDSERVHATVYSAGASERALADERLRAEDLARETGFDPSIGGYQVVLGNTGSLLVNLHLGLATEAWLVEMDRLLETETLLVSFDVGSEFRPRQDAEFQDWLNGTRGHKDIPLFADKLPKWDVVKRAVP